MRVYNQVVARLDSHVKQLEGLAYSKDVMTAAQLLGHIQECIYISEVPNTYQVRIEKAMRLVGENEPGEAPADTALLGMLSVAAQEADPN